MSALDTLKAEYLTALAQATFARETALAFTRHAEAKRLAAIEAFRALEAYKRAQK